LELSSKNLFTPHAQLERLISRNPNLTFIRLDNFLLPTSLLINIGNYCQDLNHLEFNNRRKFTPANIATALIQLKKMQFLKICDLKSSQTLFELNNLTSSVFFNLISCTAGDNSWTPVLSALNNINTIEINNNNVFENGFRVFIDSNKISLQSIKLIGFERVSHTTLQYVLKTCTNLEHISLPIMSVDELRLVLKTEYKLKSLEVQYHVTLTPTEILSVFQQLHTKIKSLTCVVTYDLVAQFETDFKNLFSGVELSVFTHFDI
jgi:hypothetical protein